jgi:DNA-3-methyladenine glycosylase
MIGRVLPRDFYNRDTVAVARDVLGKALRHGEAIGIIVEAEAYLGGDDLASHSSRGVTDRTRVIFGLPGHAYVYLIYGMYECLNIVAEPEGTPGCVLIRALEPMAGIEIMRTRRPAVRRVEQLTSGPGRLTRAMGITRALNGADLTTGPLTVHEYSGLNPGNVVASPRIGVTQCADWPLRFHFAGNAFVSR